MNKLFVTLIAAMLVFSLCSCGKKGGASSQKPVLVMATNAAFEPYEYIDENGKITGIDPEIMAEICNRIGYDLKIEDIAFDSIIPEVVSRKADVGMAGMTVTEDRKQSVSFTRPYVFAYQVIIVPVKSGIASRSDLAGKKIGVQLGTTGDEMVTAMEGISIQRFAKGPEAIVALNQGKVDAVVIDNAPAKEFVSKNSDSLTILDEPLSDECYAIAVRKDNQMLLELIDGTLSIMEADGTLDAIVNKYLLKE